MSDRRQPHPDALLALMAVCAVMGPMIPPPIRRVEDAPTCDRCGEVMLLDASGDLFLCHNPLCGMTEAL